MAGAFNTGEAIGYFLTWTTYGSWLPGDERGWNRKGETENLPANPLFEQMALASLDEDPFLLNQEGQQIVEETIRKHCEIRVWNCMRSTRDRTMFMSLLRHQATHQRRLPFSLRPGPRSDSNRSFHSEQSFGLRERVAAGSILRTTWCRRLSTQSRHRTAKMPSNTSTTRKRVQS